MKSEISESILERFAEEIMAIAEDNVADEHSGTCYTESIIEDEVEIETGWCIQFSAKAVQRNEKRSYDYPGYSGLYSVTVEVDAIYDAEGGELSDEDCRHAEKKIQDMVNRML